MSVTLYYAPFTRATRIAFLLEELGVEWNRVTLDLAAREHKTPVYLALNPNGTLPTLRDGDMVVFETLAVALYLADRFTSRALAPAADSPLRGKYLTLMAYAVVSLEPITGEVYLMQSRPAAEQDAATLEQARQRFKAGAGVLTAALGHNPWLLGDSFSAADALAGSILAFADMLGLLDGLEPLQQYVARITARPAYLRANA